MVMWQGRLIAAKQAGAGRASSLEEDLETSRIEVAPLKQKLAISTVSVPTARDPERLLRQVGLQLPSSHIRSLRQRAEARKASDRVTCLMQAVLILMCAYTCTIVLQASPTVVCITDHPAADTYQAAASCFLQAAHLLQAAHR